MKAIVLVVILIHMSHKTAQLCPKYCMCKLGAQAEWLRIKCGNELQDIRTINIDSVSVQLVQLDLSNNNINAIDVDIFKNLSNLKRLNLSQNNITSIDDGCFNGLKNLERLDLNKNQISTIGPSAFEGLTNLRRLDLSGNNISIVEPSLFYALIALERLKLNDNRITTISEGTFYGLKFIKQLDLSNNPWRCDCDLYWLSNWIYNNSIKLSPAPKCARPSNIKGEFVKKLKYSQHIQCQGLPVTIELQPMQNQIVFAGDSIILKCRVPSITKDENGKLSWLWHANTSFETADLNAYVDPRKTLSNIRIDNRYLADSGIIDSSLSITSIEKEHNGQWNCLLLSANGNRSKTISIIVISNDTRYCPLAVTKSNKGIFTWPKTIVGWKAELPCEGSYFADLSHVSLKASYQCNISGYWENLNTDLCPYISHMTKSLEQFSKINFSLAKGSLLETARKFKNYTGNFVQIKDPVDIHLITQVIENYLLFLTEEKELSVVLIDIISSLFTISKNIFKDAEISFNSCTRLIKSIEKILESTHSTQFYKKNMALEEFKVERNSFMGLICTWYSNDNLEQRFLQCTTSNGTSPVNINDRVIEASIHIPASLLQHSEEGVIHQLMISAYSSSHLFPISHGTDNMDIVSCIIGSKLFHLSVQNLTEPVYIMLKAPKYYYVGKRMLPAIWDETLNTSGGWTSDGCHLKNMLNNLVVFHCNRLGYYGLLQDTSFIDMNNISITNVKLKHLNPLMYIGSIITIMCLTVMSVTYIICYTQIAMPKKAKHSIINTWFAMTLLSVFYSIGIHQTGNKKICQGTGLALHYFSLCPLLWMTIFARNMYKNISKSNMKDTTDSEVHDRPLPKSLLGHYLVGWGIAMIICGISGAINLQEYAGYSYCFLTSGPAHAAIFLPAGILIIYIIISSLRIKCAMQNIDFNVQISHGTQAIENMNLELLECGTSSYMDKNSIYNARIALSDIDDCEHNPTMQLMGQNIMLILYLMSWSAAAVVTTRPFNAHVSFDETIFGSFYSFSSCSLAIFVFYFYGFIRNDVRSQWIKVLFWFKKQRTECCGTQSISDANSAVPTQSLVQNLVHTMSNSQGVQITSDSNSLGSSRHTNRSYGCDTLKFTEIKTQGIVSVARKVENVNLVVLHRQRYRPNNSVTAYIKPTCGEMFYNPHQSGVAKKFFKKQRQNARNNFSSRKQNHTRNMQNVTNYISGPQSIAKLESNIDQTIISGNAKVNNINISVELNPINNIKSVNMQPNGSDNVCKRKSTSKQLPSGQDGLLQNVRKIKTRQLPEFSNAKLAFQKNNWQETLNTIMSESDTEIKVDDGNHLEKALQQCTLEYTSNAEYTAHITSKRSNYFRTEVYAAKDINVEGKLLRIDFQNKCKFYEIESKHCKTNEEWLRHASSMYSLPIDSIKSQANNCGNSLNDISSFTSAKEQNLKSLVNLHNLTSTNLCKNEFTSQKLLSKLKHLTSNGSTVTRSNLCISVQEGNCNTSIKGECAFSVCSEGSNTKHKLVNSITDLTSMVLSSLNIVEKFHSANEITTKSDIQKNKIRKTQVDKMESSV